MENSFSLEAKSWGLRSKLRGLKQTLKFTIYKFVIRKKKKKEIFYVVIKLQLIWPLGLEICR
jgi:hypothetical protein